MNDIVCHSVRHSKFIDRDIVFDITSDDTFGKLKRIETSVKLRNEFKDLGVAFHLNRVEMKFSCSISTSKTDEWAELRESIRKFCDTRLEGYWSWKIKSHMSKTTDQYLYDMELFFERREDMDLWLKEQGLVLRLSK